MPRTIKLLTLKIAFLSLIASLSFADVKVFTNEQAETSNAKINFSQITTDEDYGSLVSEESFYKIVANVYSLYAMTAKNSGRTMYIKTLDWKTPYFSAWAGQDNEASNESLYHINFWGGLARLPYMTNAAFALVACHEVGHILGGEPRIKINAMHNMSSEGQSDYFAASHCLKNYAMRFELPLEVEVDPYITARCFEKFNDDKENFEICLQVAQAGNSLAHSLAFLSDFEGLNISSPSENQVNETLFNSYPDVQCRLDTFMQAALSDFRSNFSDEIPSGDRPACWFRE